MDYFEYYVVNCFALFFGDIMTKYLFTHYDTVIGQETCKTVQQKSAALQTFLPITYTVGESIFLYFDGVKLSQSYSIKDFIIDSAIVDAMSCGYFNVWLHAKGYRVHIIT